MALAQTAAGNTKTTAISSVTAGNPLLAEWTAPFDKIEAKHYRPAFDQALAAHKTEIDAIASNKDAPTFDNTIVALERAGSELGRVSRIFFALIGSNATDETQAIQREIAPILAQHSTAINLNPALFARIEAVKAQRDTTGLTDEQKRLLDETYKNFIRAGAKLDQAGKDRLAAINSQLATVYTTFAQNVLADEKSYKMVLDKDADLAGLPDFLRTGAASAAKEAKLDGKYVITLSRSSYEPFMVFSERRDLREKLFKAFIARGDNPGEHDNKPVILQILALRIEKAKLLGFASYADYQLADRMAKTPGAATELLMRVWPVARARALEERDDMQKLIDAQGGKFKLAAWDWRHYAEKVRSQRYDLNEAEVKPYFQLDKIIEAVQYTSGKLYGLTFTERKDVPVYHPDVRVWEVKDRAGKHVGLFYGDYFARTGKRSGAWATAFRPQQRLTGDVRPIIVNVLNLAKAAPGQPALLSFDEAETVFHEFGHALHGLLSDATYPSLSGTAVYRDFVEFPSQFNEHFLHQPEVLEKFAVHYQTGKPIPKPLLDRVLKARTFNQGFQTVEYVSSALVDMNFHLLQTTENLDVAKFEKESLDGIGMPSEIVMRHRTPHFGHIWAGDGYSAGYYSYMWAEVLETDAFNAFRETGNVFDPATAEKMRKFILSAGNLRDPAEAYQLFRGKQPSVEPLLVERGLIPASEVRTNGTN